MIIWYIKLVYHSFRILVPYTYKLKVQLGCCVCFVYVLYIYLYCCSEFMDHVIWDFVSMTLYVWCIAQIEPLSYRMLVKALQSVLFVSPTYLRVFFWLFFVLHVPPDNIHDEPWLAPSCVFCFYFPKKHIVSKYNVNYTVVFTFICPKLLL